MTETKNLYEDRFIQITDTHIILKKYYFPSFRSKKIEFKDIEMICTDHDYGVTPLGYKSWGMGISKIFWAWGGFSRPESNYILRKFNESMCSGFSVENPTKFREVLTSKGITFSNKRQE